MKLLDKDGLTYYTGKVKSVLTNYVQFTDYASSSKGGVITVVSNYGIGVVAANGNLYAAIKNYEAYSSANSNLFIGKGTLENVITGKALETSNNKVTSLSSASTDTQYPSAKCVYDIVGNIESILTTLDIGGGVQ